MFEQYITKAYRQRTSLVTSIPIEVRVKLGMKKGDYIVWQVDEQSAYVQIRKVPVGGNSNDRSKGNYDRKDQGGRT